jgi:hypothetical protein
MNAKNFVNDIYLLLDSTYDYWVKSLAKYSADGKVVYVDPNKTTKDTNEVLNSSSDFLKRVYGK